MYIYINIYKHFCSSIAVSWNLKPLVCDLHAGVRHGRKWKKFKGSLWGCNMMSATGNRMLLQTASHDTASESVASLTFVLPPSASHAINFTSLSIPKSTSFHANARLATSFFFFRGEFPLRFSWGAVHLSAQLHRWSCHSWNLCNNWILNK